MTTKTQVRMKELVAKDYIDRARDSIHRKGEGYRDPVLYDLDRLEEYITWFATELERNLGGGLNEG